jgi:hypothetical protein
MKSNDERGTMNDERSAAMMLIVHRSSFIVGLAEVVQ